MTTNYYEERLRAFAEGKRLGRLAKRYGIPRTECVTPAARPCRFPYSASGTR